MLLTVLDIKTSSSSNAKHVTKNLYLTNQKWQFCLLLHKVSGQKNLYNYFICKTCYMSTQIHEFVNSNGPKMGSDVKMVGKDIH